MSHEMEQMMYLGETPWHGLGVKLETAPTTREAIVAAGLDWKVALKDLQTVPGPDGWGAQPVAHKACYRVTDGSILGVVGPGWQPLQNDTAFSWFDPFLESGEASLETAGSLRAGKRVWILARLNRAPSEIVKGDDVIKYLLLSNAHDGVVAARVGFTPVRVVCANTLAMAHDDGASKLIRVHHKVGMQKTMEAIRATMNLANQEFEATAEQYRFLASRRLNEADLERYVQKVFSPKPRKDEATGEMKLVTPPKILEAVKELLEAGKGHALDGVAGTYWGAYNGVTEYLSYGRGSDAEIRLDKLWFGDAANLNNRAFTSALEMAVAA